MPPWEVIFAGFGFALAEKVFRSAKLHNLPILPKNGSTNATKIFNK